MVVGGKALSPGDRIPGFQEKESLTLGIRDALPKASRSIPRRLSLEPLAQSRCAPVPHYIHSASPQGHNRPMSYILQETEAERGNRGPVVAKGRESQGSTPGLTYLKRVLYLPCELFSGKTGGQVGYCNHVRADSCTACFGRQQTQGRSPRPPEPAWWSSNSSCRTELAR